VEKSWGFRILLYQLKVNKTLNGPWLEGFYLLTPNNQART
jgi:hypothetical protein